jgi:hypothetical protein
LRRGASVSCTTLTARRASRLLSTFLVRLSRSHLLAACRRQGDRRACQLLAARTHASRRQRCQRRASA